MIYYIILFISLIFVAYVMGITIVTLIDRHLSRISINLPKQNVIVKMPENSNGDINKNDKNDKNNRDNEDYEEKESNYQKDPVFGIQMNNIEGFENFKTQYVPNEPYATENITVPTMYTDVCYKDHCHKQCQYGQMNYPDPYLMSPIDKRFFKYNFQNNFTLQDYINWLWLHKNTEEDLPYEHLKNLMKIKRGDKIKNISKIKLQNPKNMEEYFKKMYNDISISEPLELENKYESYNINLYPPAPKKNKK